MSKMDNSIKWMENRQGKVEYSMQYRIGPNSYDCSSAVYYAICDAFGIEPKYPVNTDSMHNWLINLGFTCVADGTEWEAQRGDVFIWGKRGSSSGAAGHTGIFIDHNNVIHCNYDNNGISIDNHDNMLNSTGMHWYAYRLKGDETSGSKLSNEEIAKQVRNGDWGNGAERRSRLTSAGYDYDAIQEIVNEGYQSATVQVGSTVQPTGVRYSTGQRIPDWVKRKTYTVKQIGEGKVLLKEINSWVNNNEIIIK